MILQFYILYDALRKYENVQKYENVHHTKITRYTIDCC